MLNIEKIEKTLELRKQTDNICSTLASEMSKGMSSGQLEIFIIDSELFLRPGSPERYKISKKLDEYSQSGKTSNKKSFCYESIQNLSQFSDPSQSPFKDLSLSMDLKAENMPDISNSFFSAENEDKKLFISDLDIQEREGNGFFNSFESTNSKPEKNFKEFFDRRSFFMENCRNNWQIQCENCNSIVSTELIITYEEPSM